MPTRTILSRKTQPRGDWIDKLLSKTHERLRTSSITLYLYNEAAEELRLTRMVGVERPGFMSGAAWEPIFKWDDGISYLRGLDGYKKYVGTIPEGALLFRKKTQRMTFQDRQRLKHHEHGDFCVAKACLWGHIDGRRKPLGQVFFTFFRAHSELKDIIPAEQHVISQVCRKLRERLDRPKTKKIRDEFLFLITRIQHRFERFTSGWYDVQSRSARIQETYRIRFFSEMIRLVLESANKIAALFDARADMFLLHGERVAWQFPRSGVFQPTLIDPKSLFAEVVQSGKEFCASMVPHTTDKRSAQGFAASPSNKPFSSVKLIPITVDGEVRLVLRFRWNGKVHFTDKLIDAIQQVRFAAGYGVSCYDEWQQRIGVQGALNLFATCPTKDGLSAAYELLAGAASILRADRIVLHHVEASGGIGGSARIYPNGVVELISKGSGQSARRNGATVAVHEISKNRNGDEIFCFDALKPELQRSTKRPYLLRLYTNKSIQPLDGQPVPGGWRYDADAPTSNSIFRTRVKLKRSNLKSEHTEAVIPLRNNDSTKVIGIVWIAFANLRQLLWWERYFLRDLMRYVAFLFQATLPRLAAQNFGHMIGDITRKTSLNIERYVSPSQFNLEIGGDDLALPDRTRTMWMAHDLIRFFQNKTLEVQSLINPLREEIDIGAMPCGALLKTAWAIATSLRTLSCDFAETVDAFNRPSEKSDKIEIIFESSVVRRTSLPAYVFGIVANALHNAVSHGKYDPYVIWVAKEHRGFRIVCGNGGECPNKNDLLASVLIGREQTYRGGVGTSVIHHLCQIHGGSWDCFDYNQAKSRYGRLPPSMRPCRTFFEIIVPKEKVYEPNHSV